MVWAHRDSLLPPQKYSTDCDQSPKALALTHLTADTSLADDRVLELAVSKSRPKGNG